MSNNTVRLLNINQEAFVICKFISMQRNFCCITIRGFAFYIPTDCFFLSQEFSPQDQKRRSSSSYIYGRCILLADYLVYRRALMDESKQGYANLCCRRANSCRPIRSLVSCKDLSLFSDVHDTRTTFCRDEFYTLAVFHYTCLCCHTFVFLDVISI